MKRTEIAFQERLYDNDEEDDTSSESEDDYI